MTSISSLHDHQSEIAARLFIRAQAGDDRDKDALREWAQGAPGRSELLASLQQGWDAVGGILDTPQMDQWRKEAQQYLQADASRQRIAVDEGPGRRTVWQTMVALAATVLIAFLGGLWLTAPHAPAEIAIEAPRNAIRIARLSDGSLVTLDRGARIKVSFDDTLRRISLDGQSSFQVAHEKGEGRPFVVRVGDREIRATGTRFNVLQDSDRIEVSLMNGRVIISQVAEQRSFLGIRRKFVARPIATLSPGHRWTEQASKTPAITVFDADEASAWERGRIILRSETLGRAAEIVSRYSATKVIVAEKGLASRRVSGAFAVGNVEGFTETISLLYPDTKVVTQHGNISITPRHKEIMPEG